MIGVPETPDRTESGTTLETAELSSGPQPGVTEKALPQIAHGCELVASPALADEVRSARAKSGYTWLRRVVVTTSGGSVVLRGTVPSYYFKQLAQIAVMAVPGVGEVRNDLAVGIGG